MHLTLGKKGQGIALDFLFAVLVFLLVLNTTMSLIDSSNESVSEKSLFNSLNAKAMQTIDRLVRTDGQPNNWELKGIDDATAIGLAKRDRALEDDKVAKFIEWTDDYSDPNGDYNKVKSLLLIGYDYYFKLSDSTGATLEETGRPGQAARDQMMAVNVKRIVNYQGEEAIAEFEIYYPR